MYFAKYQVFYINQLVKGVVVHRLKSRFVHQCAIGERRLRLKSELLIFGRLWADRRIPELILN